MAEINRTTDILWADLKKIGIAQVDDRNWVSENHYIQKLDWRNIPELEEVGNIQDRIWGFGALNVVPSHILAVVEETGGDLLTAYGQGGKPEAFTLTLATSNPQKLFLHMVGVEPSRQSNNIGRELMLLEGALARSRGVRKIEWTYDPLMGGNSNLYISKLKAVPYKYTINKYGIVKNGDANTESRYKNVETDRFTVGWAVGDEKTWNLATGSAIESPLINVPAVWSGEGDAPDTFRVEVPFDFTKLSTDEMMDARMDLRKVALRTMDADDIATRDYKPGTHEVVRFIPDPNKVKNSYVFSKKISDK